ncbi:MAG: DNA repair protein RecO [Candidatus Abyssobacteria bacterium SURF_5]|uniref:DNA repair protein RecO n=1 Tax=Abyssobacteria bacterium (strain SURF_5) TaxID=2093360 RepID=A0A3A4N8R7_ABYX5|nr:MAG: DNA repair protein RecO [Candidatus Abyssubacteria bacterium SURF_5]
MAVEQCEAIVLHTYNLTDSSKIVVLLTPARGKVRAVAKGVRRTKSKFGSSLEPITRIEVQVYFKEGRDLQNLSQAETRDSYPSVRSDLKRLGLGSVMCELIEQFVQENEEASEYFSLLSTSLKLLSEMPKNHESLLIFFYLKLLDISGLLPDFSRCARCKNPVQGVAYLDAGAGGVLCGACTAGSGEKLSAGSARIMEQLMRTDREMFERIRIPASSVEEMLNALNAYVVHHTGRQLKSAQYLNRVALPQRPK